MQNPQPDALLEDFRKLRVDFIRRGLFVSSSVYYLWKCVSNLALFFTAAAILMSGNDSWAACCMSALILGLGWQQSGWLAHDFLHHQVFTNRAWNNAVGLFFGNVVQVCSCDFFFGVNQHVFGILVSYECQFCATKDDKFQGEVTVVPAVKDILVWSGLRRVPACAVPSVWARSRFSHEAVMVAPNQQTSRTAPKCTFNSYIFTYMNTLHLYTSHVVK